MKARMDRESLVFELSKELKRYYALAKFPTLLEGPFGFWFCKYFERYFETSHGLFIHQYERP